MAEVQKFLQPRSQGLIRCNSRGQGKLSSVDSVVTDHLSVKYSEKKSGQVVVNDDMSDIHLFVFTISHPSREVGCELFSGLFSGLFFYQGINLTFVVAQRRLLVLFQ